MSNSFLDENTGVLFMKVGVHAQEPLEEIIARKNREIQKEGFAMWGYGGGTCHPTTMVQPFARTFEKKGGRILLCMQEMESSHFADKVRADEFSTDGISWKNIPDGINVLGSRYALVINGLRRTEDILPLDRTVVAVGNSQGRAGNLYIKGRVDKACLAFNPAAPLGAVDTVTPINLLAEINSPYAVFLRNRPT